MWRDSRCQFPVKLEPAVEKAPQHTRQTPAESLQKHLVTSTATHDPKHVLGAPLTVDRTAQWGLLMSQRAELPASTDGPTGANEVYRHGYG
ncbi:hypothetical protein Q5P01_001343 [Channa striata]|uniref:Uncharacterized protein n=1 Tax=Channa striata TaxID=64152 RepID=A0AA88NP73_CHASR|nr:hypothetical protein Q5P01_001343 [Channa striata]